MNQRQQAIAKINSFPNNWLNNDQKNIMIKILEKSDIIDLESILSFLLTRVKKAGFVFDYSPNINSGLIAIIKEKVRQRINVTDDVIENENTLIIGENYDALKNLLIIYRNKIDFIYIDPPYNTEAAKNEGNNNSSYKENTSNKFIYKDKFARDGWLTMMKERLEQAHTLLKSNGIIFISIDDNEQAYLKILMDDIFGEENFIGCMIWKSSGGGRMMHFFRLIPNISCAIQEAIKKVFLNFQKQNRLKQINLPRRMKILPNMGIIQQASYVDHHLLIQKNLIM